MKRRFLSLFFALLYIMLLAGCQERRLYPLESLSADRLETVLFLFSENQYGKYSQEFFLQGSQMDDVVEVLRGLRMTSEVEWGSVSSGVEIILLYKDGQAIEIEGGAEVVRIGDRYYLWPWKSQDSFERLIGRLYEWTVVITQFQEMLDLLYKVNASFGFEDSGGISLDEW
ncbi:MAG: hypothetical protein HFJ85_00635 [Oscillospiraceae bacterium]|nr:hypothetical protein [Oscillospiraceae bacterium]